jgi:hypothetical protein
MTIIKKADENSSALATANSYFEVLFNKHLLQDLFFLSFCLDAKVPKSQGFI